MDEFLFVKLLYNTKLAEGYSLDDIPKLIQESLYVSGYGYYKIESINNVICSITQDNNIRKSRGYIMVNLFYIIGIIISLLTIIYCFL